MSIKKFQHAMVLHVVLLLLSLGSGTLAQAAPAGQSSFRPRISYSLHIPEYSNQELKLCLGEYEYVDVLVSRIVDDVSVPIAGGRILASSNDEEVAIVEGVDGAASDVRITKSSFTGKALLAGLPYAYFEIKGLKPGTTTIDFDAVKVGDEAIFPGRTLSAPRASLKVRVDTCYEATQSALGDEFLEKDICSLERPFALETRHTMSVGGATVINHTRALFFVPRRKNMLQGRYAFVNGQTTRAPDGTILSGIEFGSGSYNLALNLQEGDITLTSDHTNCFSGDCFPVAITGYQILIKPLPNGELCEGMLP